MYPIDLLGKLRFLSPNIVLEKSPSPGAWDGWGVRDAAILCDESGNFQEVHGNLVMYYTGSCESGQRQGTGRAVSHDGGLTWRREPDTPVLEPSLSAWDRQIAATPWVIKVGGIYRLYYRGAKKVGECEGLGLAISTDGINFDRYAENPILTTSAFPGIRDHPSTMGVPNIVRMHDGDYILMFEACESGFEHRGQIFAARSKDGFCFFPLNEGYPVFSSRHVQSWPVRGVCNPRLLPLDQGWYMLGFNGSYNGEYSIGFAFTQDFKTWYEHPQNPLIVPRGWPPGDPFTNRIEGPVFDRKAIFSRERYIKCYFMSIPLGARNHENAVNALSFAERCSNTEESLNFLALPSNAQSVQVIDQRIILDGTIEQSGFVQAHKSFKKSIKSIHMSLSEFNMELGGEVYIVFSNTMNSLPRGLGTALKFSRNGVFLRPEPSNNVLARVFRRLARGFRPTAANPLVPAPLGSWVLIQKLNEDARHLDITVSFNTPGILFIKIGGEFHAKSLTASSQTVRILTFAVVKTALTVEFDPSQC